MLRLFKKDNSLYAPVRGHCMDIKDCKDAMFSSKALGDGFMIIPNDNCITSPCNGIVDSIFPTKHAISIKMSDGKEILLHIGIDTVRLEGKPFKAFVKRGDKVKRGDTLIVYDTNFMQENNIDMSTIVIILNSAQYSYTKQHLNEAVHKETCIIQCNHGE